jgi:hypothetical protein
VEAKSSSGGNGSNTVIFVRFYWCNITEFIFWNKNCNLLCQSDFSSQTKHTNSQYWYFIQKSVSRWNWLSRQPNTPFESRRRHLYFLYFRYSTSLPAFSKLWPRVNITANWINPRTTFWWYHIYNSTSSKQGIYLFFTYFFKGLPWFAWYTTKTLPMTHFYNWPSKFVSIYEN